MTKKWIGTQIVLNNVNYHELERNDCLRRKLSLAKETLNLDTLIIWPDSDYKGLHLTREICLELKIKTYLWYPVLADISLFRIRLEQTVETFQGLHGYGASGSWEKLGQGGEDFFFLCPNDSGNLNNIFQHFQHILKLADLDGVFLDRIRFPSPANGLETIYTCFCPYCLESFYNDYGEDLNKYRNEIKNIFKRFKTLDIDGLVTYEHLSQIFMSANLKKFFDFRRKSIYKTTKMFADKARENGKLIGLDLFAPSLAALVGQDYKLLAEVCDWIKPMIYCHTTGPAGLPLELSSLLKALMNLAPNLEEELLIQEISRMLGVCLPGKRETLLKKGVPEEIIRMEMQKVNDSDLEKKTKIYIGWEAVQIPDIAYIDSGVLEKYLSTIWKSNLEGKVISRDLLKIPDENLKLVGDFLLKQ